MPLYAVRYEYAPGSAESRDSHRPAHVEFLRGLFESGSLVVSGRLEDQERSGALLVLRADDARAADGILDEDPFWAAGVIGVRDAREWNVVFGGEAVR